MRVGVLLVNYNGKQYNDICIKSILGSKAGFEIHVYIVDNASTDDSLAFLKRSWGDNSKVHILETDENGGFAAGNNIAIREAATDGCEYIILLNNDTHIKPDTLSQLVECSREHGRCVTVPKILYDDEKDVIWYAGGRFSSVVGKAIHTGMNQTDDGRYDQEQTTEFATGCCICFPRKILDRLGEMDESYFLYYEDTEYSLRMKEYGIRIRYCPKAVVYHRVSASTKGSENPMCAYYIARNWLRCNLKYLRGGRKILFLIYFVMNRTVWCLIWLIRGKRACVTKTIEGIRDFRAGRWRQGGEQ